MLASNYGYFDEELCKRQIVENLDKSSIYPVEMICIDFKPGLKKLEKIIIDKDISE
jgi:hypothetical protein